MPKKLTQLPKEILVTVEQEGTEDQYLQVNESARDAADPKEKKRGALYVLQDYVIVESVASAKPVGVGNWKLR